MNLQQEATEFIQLMHQELGISKEMTNKRLNQIETEIIETHTYRHTYEELEFGAKVAWRHSNRCIGRLFYDKLTVVDKRDINTREEIVEALESHIQFATNDGRLIPTISIFNSDTPFQLMNDQLIRYANDPLSEEVKILAEKLTQKKITSRILPWVYQYNNQFYVHHLDETIVKEVPLTHPEYQAFDALHLSWYAVPIISAMNLNIGGIIYSLCPFNGWYMESEIASRNLLDTYRYDLLKPIAESFNLDTNKTTTYWRDKALVELNYAVYHSYKKAGVSIVDHYTASKQFEKFEENETACGRTVTGDWTWLIPPISPSLVHNWHKGYDNTYRNPNFYYKKKMKCPFH